MRWPFLSLLLALCAVVAQPLRAAPDDVEGSHDYPEWARLPGFEITDYDEDNPADFTFSVAKPTPDDPAHLEGVVVPGHRYVIQYGWSGPGSPPSASKIQRHYDRLASENGYKVEKSAKVGGAAETFHLSRKGRDIWIFFNPAEKAYTLTVVDAKTQPVTATPAPGPAPVVLAPPPTLSAIPAPGFATAATQPPALTAPSPSPGTNAPAAAPPVAAGSDPLLAELLRSGRATLPITFLPGKTSLTSDSESVIARLVEILKQYPDWSMTIEGHTDLTGDENANLELSKERAMEVRSDLIAGHISRKRLTAVGLGGTQPIADDSTAEGRQKNRRIELVITPPSKSVSQGKTVRSSSSATTGNSDEFHEIAPNGINYYPAPNKIVAPPPPPNLPSN